MNYLIGMALTNMLGGRWGDVWSGKFPINGRMFWRGIMPGILSGFVAFDIFNHVPSALYVWVAVTLGSLFWYCFGWSFEEITGTPDPTKYPKWIRWIGYSLFPNNDKIARNQQRGMVMKGLRGMFDIFTFVLLLPINEYALLAWVACFAMGPIYRGVAWAVASKNNVLAAELVYGFWRGSLILITLAAGSIEIFM